MSDAPWITNIVPTIEHGLQANEHMGVVGCLCGWWGSGEDAAMHADAVIEDGGECPADWQELSFGLSVAAVRIDMRFERTGAKR